MGVARELKGVVKELDSITIKKDLAQFLSDTENAQKLNGLVRDIRDALIGYQVCTPKLLALVSSNNASDLIPTRYL
jgi:hypothetical protein